MTQPKRTYINTRKGRRGDVVDLNYDSNCLPIETPKVVISYIGEPQPHERAEVEELLALS